MTTNEATGFSAPMIKCDACSKPISEQGNAFWEQATGEHKIKMLCMICSNNPKCTTGLAIGELDKLLYDVFHNTGFNVENAKEKSDTLAIHGLG